MGASLSPAGSHSAGTLGPYVQRKQSKVICALTCYHVAQEAPADLGTITRNPAEFDACDIVCPAEGDMATIHKELEERIADDQCWLETHSADPAGQRRAADLARAIAVNQAKIDKYRAQRVMGKVCAGHLRFPTATEMTYSDCALIEVADPGSVSTVFDTVGQDEDFCNRFMDPALLERTQRVTKFGRSTGSTSATVNGYRFAASMETPFGLAESFWAFAAWSEERHSAFTEKGDSGAAVVWERNIVGLVFGGIEGEVETSRGQRAFWTSLQSLISNHSLVDEPLVDKSSHCLACRRKQARKAQQAENLKRKRTEKEESGSRSKRGKLRALEKEKKEGDAEEEEDAESSMSEGELEEEEFWLDAESESEEEQVEDDLEK
ncbi:hypothetical protein BCR37DRAFT_388751 [Protomyces lactucae-debilis]|uniref:Uncharacterized protein n=1 Tax=Protomyces lactucae-debilis TaxID=2754530 RepID=A0A1Y2F3X3_PROLT|nr:uncharacterized protein BCR37DRAFT_388751 [Protomyces lactucae-debilis]ORY78562.1 hypothetical protein BCR37DRAFT_388751 [Protomyces lactucae-debilis]